LPEAVVVEAFEQAAMGEPELKVTRRSGEVLLVGGGPATPRAKAPTGVIDRIRALFDRTGEEAEKISLLDEQRATLALQRDRIYEGLIRLEQKEVELLQEGRATSSSSARRRIANQLAHLRKDVARQNTLVRMVNSQIDVISTHIHNLTLIQQGQMAELPQAEELTRSAVQAEEMLESLTAEAELAASLETRTTETVTGDEEAAILREFEGAAGAQAPPESPPSQAAQPEGREAASPGPAKEQRPAADAEA
jgi:hypothetical protein